MKDASPFLSRIAGETRPLGSPSDMTPKRTSDTFPRLFGLSVLLAVAPLILCGAPTPAATGQPIRGTPIDSPPRTNAPDPATIRARPKRRTPGSVQRRMVQYLINESASANAAAGPTVGGSPAKVIFSPSKLATLPETPLPPGYERLGFETLSAFPFEATREVAEGTTNSAVGTLASRPAIPADVMALDGHLVAVRGFLIPVKMNNGLTFEFLLLRNQNLCCFGSNPKINEWITVQAKGEGVKPVMDQPVTVMGRLHVGEIREQGYLVGLYRLDAEHVVLLPGY
jgi:hypothetical protein